MKTARLALAALLLAAPLSLAPLAHAQTTEKAESSESYLITLALKISDKGKVISDQTYTLAATTNSHMTPPAVRDGDRVPITVDSEGGKTNIQYIDTGTNIDLREIKQMGELVVLNINMESSLAVPNSALQGDPTIRQTRYTLTPSVRPGKAVTIYSSNDTTTGHKVEIQLTLQPLNK